MKECEQLIPIEDSTPLNDALLVARHKTDVFLLGRFIDNQFFQYGKKKSNHSITDFSSYQYVSDEQGKLMYVK